MKKLKWQLLIKSIEQTFFNTIEFIIGGIVLKNIMDNIYIKNFNNLSLYIVIYCISLMSEKFHLIVAYYINKMITLKIDKDIILQYFNRILNYDIDFFKNNLSGSIVNKLFSIAKNITTIYKTTYRIINFCIFIIISFCVFCYYDYKLALFFVIILIITLIVNYTCLNKRKELSKQMETVKNKTNGLIIDSFINILNIKLFNNQFKEFRQIKQQNNIYLKSLKKEKMYTAKNMLYSYLCFTLLLFGMMCITFIDYHNKKITIGAFVFIFQFILSFVKWYKYLIGYAVEFTNNMAKLMSNIDIIRQQSNIVQKSNLYKNMNISNGKITFKNISFNYQEN